MPVTYVIWSLKYNSNSFFGTFYLWQDGRRSKYSKEPWCFSLDICPIGAPIEYAHNNLHVTPPEMLAFQNPYWYSFVSLSGSLIWHKRVKGSWKVNFSGGVSDHVPPYVAIVLLLDSITTQNYLGPRTHIYVMTWSYVILKSIQAIHEINALREVSNGWANSYWKALSLFQRFFIDPPNFEGVRHGLVESGIPTAATGVRSLASPTPGPIQTFIPWQWWLNWYLVMMAVKVEDWLMAKHCWHKGWHGCILPRKKRLHLWVNRPEIGGIVVT